MNYYQARQRQSDKRWDWTCQNDGRIWAAGPCANHTDGHATSEEAERHYYDDEMAHLEERKTGDFQHRCAICGVWTQMSLGHRGLGAAEFFCDAHRTREGFEKLHPFAPHIRIASSY